MQNHESYVCIDISADWLDVYVLAKETFQHYAGTKQGRQNLIRWLKGYTPVARIIMEATGGPERAKCWPSGQ